ncbi:MAG: hypothetical protein J5651_00310 [Salinivirgaceae bacterium]|nr:hypothetical protein [Salinivirgaceae bacterium]
MAQIIVVSDAQKEILEKVCTALLNEPMQQGERKVINFDMRPYTISQLRGLVKQVFNSMDIPR